MYVEYVDFDSKFLIPTKGEKLIPSQGSIATCLDRLEWSSNQQFTGFGRCDAMGLILEVNLNGLCVDKTLKGGGKGSDLSF